MEFDGKVTTAFVNNAVALSVAIQPNGKIIAAGNGGYNFFSIARYNGDAITSFAVSENTAVNNTFFQALKSKQPVKNINTSLSQNFPNPFNQTTTINYNLPQQYASAKIIVTDKSGNILKEINLYGNKKGNIRIDAATVSSGAYQYSLIVDGKLMDTKQMIITN